LTSPDQRCDRGGRRRHARNCRRNEHRRFRRRVDYRPRERFSFLARFGVELAAQDARQAGKVAECVGSAAALGERPHDRSVGGLVGRIGIDHSLEWGDASQRPLGDRLDLGQV
jgi:hypothetical protein